MVVHRLDDTSNRMKPSVPSNGFVLPPKHYKIGELVEFTGLCRQTLHNYTRWGLIDETHGLPVDIGSMMKRCSRGWRAFENCEVAAP